MLFTVISVYVEIAACHSGYTNDLKNNSTSHYNEPPVPFNVKVQGQRSYCKMSLSCRPGSVKLEEKHARGKHSLYRKSLSSKDVNKECVAKFEGKIIL